MTIKSMTGFARSDGAIGPTGWHWEVRSVNGRGLDIRLRLPPGYDALEARIREAVGKRVTRGSLTVNLNVKHSEGATQIRLNEAALRQVLAALDSLKATAEVAAPRAEALLAIKGVLEVVEPEESEAEMQARTEAMLASLEVALDGMVRARAAEGRRLNAIVLEQVASIERLVAVVGASPARSPEAIRQRLKDQIGRLLEAGANLDEGRLYQEAAILATRADVEEELKRLGAHIAGARELVASREPAGRRLDFLAQEFNREANTLCSKAIDPETTRAGLELKAVIDQMREQVQNIE
jgi:uncharacterized protein (TIGR00255 family)